MKTVIELLDKELKEWREHFESEKIYFKDEEQDKHAIKSFAECELKISELQKAIDILAESESKNLKQSLVSSNEAIQKENKKESEVEVCEHKWRKLGKTKVYNWKCKKCGIEQ